MITDEQLEKACRAVASYWEEATDTHWRQYRHPTRAVLEAIAPELLAQGMEKAADLIEKAGGRPGYVAPDYQPDTIKLAAELIRASAKQTREGKGP